MKLDEFLTNALIESMQNGLIAPELITVYAGNYLTKSLITVNEITQVQNAVVSYKAEQTSDSSSTSESTSATANDSETASMAASSEAPVSSVTPVSSASEAQASSASAV